MEFIMVIKEVTDDTVKFESEGSSTFEFSRGAWEFNNYPSRLLVTIPIDETPKPLLNKDEPRERPYGDADGRCLETEVGVNGSRRCQGPSMHFGPHDFGLWNDGNVS